MRGRKNYLDIFEEWMIRRGKKTERRKIPSQQMSPATAHTRKVNIRRILRDIGYVSKKKIKGNGYEWTVYPSDPKCKPIRSIKPEEFIVWMDKEFPYCQDRKDRQRKAAYANAIYKFAEFLVYPGETGIKNFHGKPIWSTKHSQKIRDEVHAPTVKTFEVDVLPLDKTDSLIEFIRTRNITHYTMIYLSRWFGGMRYQEVVNAKLDLNSPTLMIDFETGKVTIYGKGEGGLQKPRYPNLIPEVKKVLLEYLEYRKTLTPKTEEDAEYLFLTKFRKRWSQWAQHFNHSLRGHARAWGELTEEEIKLISSHRIGRHAFATYWYPKMQEKPLMKEMGLEKEKDLHRYANVTREERGDHMRQVRAKDNKHVQKSDKLSLIKELLGELTREEKKALAMELVS